MIDVEPPLFVFSDDLASFDSVGGLLRHVEPIDVDEHMRAFDAHGHELVLRSIGVKRTGVVVGGGRVEITDVVRGEQSMEAFTRLLRRHAVQLRQHLGTRWTSDVDVETARLPTLVNDVHSWTRTA